MTPLGEFVVQLSYYFCFVRAEAIDHWLDESIAGKVGVIATTDDEGDDVIQFYFEFEDDATAFKLRWR